MTIANENIAATKIADYYTTERIEFADFISQFGTFNAALDIGCASGRLGACLTSNGITRTCDGIEPFMDAAAIASTTLNRVWNGTIESVANQVAWCDYDVICMADVLEHLVDPWSALRNLSQQTKQTCKLALSVPNIRHYKIVFPLLFTGAFQYEDQGIMDRTHLHFFTQRSLEETLAQCGWRITGIAAHMKKKYRKLPYPTRLIEPFVAVQYFVMAEKR
jgi:2-polyprenyl-3-methyl-5-hydroxy-6-metoxy-1,4-benzoquinol methylase